MPIATINPNHFEKFELTTAPPDPNIPGDENGFVMLRPLPYGLILERQDKTMRMRMKTNAGRPQDRKRKGEDNSPDIDMQTLHAAGQMFDFAYCIGGHNLTDGSGELLDFTNAMVFKILDPKIAQEIESLIDDLNNPEGTESAEDFIRRASGSPKIEELSSLSKEDLNIQPVMVPDS